MKIAYVPGRELSYSRTSIFSSGMEKNGVELRNYGVNYNSLIKRSVVVPLKFLFRKNRDEDVVIVGFLGQPLAIFLRPFVRKKMVLDAYLSMYDSMVFDRKKVSKDSFLAKVFYWLDKKSCQVSDRVFVDTYEHIDYFSKTFSIPKEKFERALIGADDSLFVPKKNKKVGDKLIVGFHGLFIPLQGVEYIIKSAKILEKENVEFLLVGGGQTYDGCYKLAKKLGVKNVKFLGLKKPEDIPEFIDCIDVGLGIFGKTEKTKRVIPNKAYEIIAMKKPLITADTPAIRELFVDKKSVYLCNAKDEKSLAAAILALKKDVKLRERISSGGYNLFKEQCNPEKIGQKIVEVCKSL